MAPDLRLYLNSLFEIVRATKKNPLALNTQTSLNKINKDSEKTPIKPLHYVLNFAKIK